MKIFGHRSVESFRRELSRNSQLRALCGLSDGKFKFLGERKNLVPPARVFSGFIRSNRSTKQRIQLITKKLPETHQISSDFLFIPIPFPYTLHQNFLHHQATHQTKAKIFQGSLLSVCHPAEANYLANNSNTYKYSNYSI